MDGATFDDDHPSGDLAARRRDYTHALVDEIRLLVRTISNDPVKRLSSLKLNCQPPGETGLRELSAPEIIIEVSTIEAQTDQKSGIAHIGFLQLVRDALVSMTAPATGLTISYTTLVAGDQRGRSAESRFTLAQRAYSLLSDRAAWHRRVAFLLTVVAIVFTLFAAWEATKVSLGKSILQNLDLLRHQQAAIAAEKLKLETSLDKSAGDADLHISANDPIPLHAVPLCDRHLLREAAMANRLERPRGLRLEASPAERELCGRDTILARNIEIVHSSLRQYQNYWPASVGGIVGAAGEVLRHLDPSDHAKPELACALGATSASQAAGQGNGTSAELGNKSPDCNDVEFMNAPMLQVTTNYVLPITFGFIGSVLYVLLDHFTKLRSNTLSPRDFPLMILRVVIGLVVAACVSLLISSSASPGPAAAGSMNGVPVAGTLVASLTLSASGITFLAGFGAEAVVTLLQGLVTRLFTTPNQATRA